MNPIKKSIKRKAAAKKIIRRRMLYAAGLGLVPIPMLDAASILSTQVLMLRDIAKLYRIPFKGQRAKSFIGALMGSAGTAGALKAIPGLGSVVGGAAMSLTGVAATYAIGKVFTLHFEQGGTLLDFDPVKSRKHFQRAYKKGEIQAAALKKENKSKVKQFINNISPTNSKKKQIGDEKEDITIAESAALIRETKIQKLKIKRRKAFKKKQRRRARIRKIIGWLLLLSLLTALIYWFYSNYTDSLYEKDGTETTELELFLEEEQAQKMQLKPAQALDSITKATIARFSPVSTEGVIAKYIQNPEAKYPIRYALNAVRFMGSSEKLSFGAELQLANIAFLMKKYPNLVINLYGHTGNTGPKFNRQRIGRDRARSLKDVFYKMGIPAYRITGNYIEKAEGTHDGYWGAEIVLHVSTIESVVEVEDPIESESALTSIIESIQEIDLLEDDPPEPKSDIIKKSPAPKVKKERVVQPDIKDKEIQPVIITNNQNQEESVAPVDSPSNKDNNILEKSKIEPQKKSSPTTTEGVMLKYIESPNPKYPKIFSLNAVLFSGEVIELEAKAKTQLMHIAELMKKYPTMKIGVYGHVPGKTAEMSPEEKQSFLLKWQEIGQKRAKTIKKELHKNGIANKRINSNHRFQNKGIETLFWGAEIVVESI